MNENRNSTNSRPNQEEEGISEINDNFEIIQIGQNKEKRMKVSEESL